MRSLAQQSNGRARNAAARRILHNPLDAAAELGVGATRPKHKKYQTIMPEQVRLNKLPPLRWHENLTT